ncbi:MAG: trigger factor [Oscillospiraceae bacterium]|nr:trigger factor [Oscillospiraceae bacterium]MBQ7341597.1 trigger factor [Oscillospiraceae bacterium]
MSFTYKGLKAELQKHIVTDEEIDRNMQRLLEQNPRIAEITDRPTENGDEVILDYAGFCDGEQFAGGTAENQTLVLGSGMFIPGFEEQLLDKVPGEEVTVKVTFPKEYHADNLAGKEAEFKCKLKAIRVKTPYELDDTFAKEVGQCETFAEMHKKMGESLQAYSDDRGEMDLQDRLLQQAAATLELNITDKMLQEAMDEQMRNLEAQLAQQGLSIDMYCQFLSTTREALREEFKATAENAIRSRAAIDEIVMIEGLTAEEEDIEQALEIICRHNGITIDQLKEQFDAGLQQAVINSVLTGKVMRLIRDSAEITIV